MQTLFDPLTKIAALGAFPHLALAADGEKQISLTFARAASRKAQRDAQAIAARFERLLVLQLDVGTGQQPRTVQQLLASGRIRVVGGRYILAGK